jgi:hypothetical protein
MFKLLKEPKLLNDITGVIHAHVKSMTFVNQITSETDTKTSMTPLKKGHLICADRFVVYDEEAEKSDEIGWAKMRINADGWCMFDTMSFIYWLHFDVNLCSLTLLLLGWKPEWDAKTLRVKGNLFDTINCHLSILLLRSAMSEENLNIVKSFFHNQTVTKGKTRSGSQYTTGYKSIDKKENYPGNAVLEFLYELLFNSETCQICVLTTDAKPRAETTAAAAIDYEKIRESRFYININELYGHIYKESCTTLYIWNLLSVEEHFEPAITNATLKVIQNQQMNVSQSLCSAALSDVSLLSLE